MKVAIGILFHIWIGCIASLTFGNEKSTEILVYRGTSDASAAVAIGHNMFIVADDENNILRVYKINQGDLPLFSYDMNEFLDVEPEHPEIDIEGAAMIGRRVYWISSHGRNKDGKIRPNRYSFFATDIEAQKGNVTIKPVGKPNKTLIHNLVKSESTNYLRLDRTTGFGIGKLSKEERQKLAPKEKGLNIEGLCASADGKTIYIGFRNPRYNDGISRKEKAIIIPLRNPDDVIEKSSAPIFGMPILLDLAGLGIRSIEYSNFHKVYFIIAGAFNGNQKFAMYRWNGKREDRPVFVNQLSLANFSPEVMITFKNSDKFLVLSDDGSLQIKVKGPWECMEGEFNKDGTCQNKYLLNPEKKTFKGIWISP
ncbi:MAG: DUF3616 domain-containing protein [Sedimentisphaerales bacterium]|nr:DUF3616 domain-containing protein [Sedimentisphaerales bacterium]